MNEITAEFIVLSQAITDQADPARTQAPLSILPDMREV